MTLNEYTPQEIEEMSMVEIAFELMKTEKQPFAFADLVKRVAEIKGLSESSVLDQISYLYTDLNIDGRFICLGENRWGLRAWYPYEQSEEEVTPTVRRKKAKVTDDDLDIDLDEDFDDLEEELDDEFEDLEDELDDFINDEDETEDDFDIDLDEETVESDDSEELEEDEEQEQEDAEDDFQ